MTEVDTGSQGETKYFIVKTTLTGRQLDSNGDIIYQSKKPEIRVSDSTQRSPEERVYPIPVHHKRILQTLG